MILWGGSKNFSFRPPQLLPVKVFRPPTISLKVKKLPVPVFRPPQLLPVKVFRPPAISLKVKKLPVPVFRPHQLLPVKVFRPPCNIIKSNEVMFENFTININILGVGSKNIL